MNSFAAEFARLHARATAAGVPDAGVRLPAQGLLRSRDGIGLHYLEWPGAPEGPLLLLLHGGGLHARTFDVVGLLLGRLGRVVALDLRGHGDSEWAPSGDGYRFDRMIDDLDLAVSAFAGRGARSRPVVVVGHSLGGLLALTWAASASQAPDGLVIVDVGPELDPAGARSVGDTILTRPEFADLDEAESFLTTRVPAVRSATTSGIAANLAWTDDAVLSWKHDPAQFRPGEQTMPSTDDLRDSARRLRCPTLVLRGDRSRVFSDRHAAEFADSVPDGRWSRVADAGHTIQTSNPAGLAAAVTEFLRDRVGVPTVLYESEGAS